MATGSPSPESHSGSQTAGGSFIVDEVIADGATLEVLPRDARKTHLTFELKLLRLSTACKSTTMVFHTEVVNALPPGVIQSDGHIGLDATVSQMTTGIKSVLLKPVDPLFKHDGAGAVVPIAVSGKRGDPSFRLDIGRAMRRH